MGANHSGEGEHHDGPPTHQQIYAPTTTGTQQTRTIPAPVQTATPTNAQQQQQKQQQQGGGGGGGQPPDSMQGDAHTAGGVTRVDSGNDFAMSIPDGAAASPAPASAAQAQHAADQAAAASAAAAAAAAHLNNNNPQRSPSPQAGHERGPDGTALMSPTPGPPKIETVPTAFKWVHGGNEVYVTGSFNNWQGKILMYPNEDGDFTLLIDIPPGTHHYKYIVDQEWRLDEDAPTVQIASVWNNVVEVKRPVFEYTPANFADSDDDEDDRKQKAAYGQRAPLSNDYVNDPPKLPPHLSDILLNQTQAQDPMMLPVPQHVVLNHLYVMQHTDPAILVTGITQRFKPNIHTKITHKFVTTVYYAPRNIAAAVASGTVSPSPSIGPFMPFPLSAVSRQPSPAPHAPSLAAELHLQQQQHAQLIQQLDNDAPMELPPAHAFR